MIHETLRDIVALLRVFLFLVGIVLFLLGLRYFMVPVSVSNTGLYSTQVTYDYGTGLIYAVPGLIMILISVFWSIANVQMPSQTPHGTVKQKTEGPDTPTIDGRTRCPHCGMEIEFSTIPDSTRMGGVISVCPHCGEKI